MSKVDPNASIHGYRPVTEGYQPGSNLPLQRGDTPTTSTGPNRPQKPPRPPTGGSSASKTTLKQQP